MQSTDSDHAFESVMMEVIEDVLYTCVLIWWIDDLLVPTKSFDEAIVRLAAVFQETETFRHNLSQGRPCEKEITLLTERFSISTSFCLEATGFDQCT
jgi:hypothetical protein